MGEAGNEKVARQCPQITTFEEKCEPTWNQTWVLLLASRASNRRSKSTRNGLTGAHVPFVRGGNDEIRRQCPGKVTCSDLISILIFQLIIAKTTDWTENIWRRCLAEPGLGLGEK